VGEDARLPQELHVETAARDRLHERPLEERGERAHRRLLEEALDLLLGPRVGLAELAPHPRGDRRGPPGGEWFERMDARQERLTDSQYIARVVQRAKQAGHQDVGVQNPHGRITHAELSA